MTFDKDSLGGGFKSVLFSSLFGKISNLTNIFSDGLKPPTVFFWGNLNHPRNFWEDDERRGLIRFV